MAKSSSRAVKTYPSKVDAWIVALIGAALAAAVIGIAIAAIDEGPLRMAQAGFITLGVSGLLVWTFLQTNYTLAGQELVIRSGPFRWRIAVSDIHDVGKPPGGFGFRSRSSPALSMDRLEIRYGKGKKLMISPVDQEKFLADLRSRQ
jgi:hypothetical protein